MGSCLRLSNKANLLDSSTDDLRHHALALEMHTHCKSTRAFLNLQGVLKVKSLRSKFTRNFCSYPARSYYKFEEPLVILIESLSTNTEAAPILAVGFAGLKRHRT